MEFTVLGPLSAADSYGSARLTGTLRRRLMAALLIRPNTVVPTDRLIDVLWGDDAPATAHRNLHNQVWRVRAALDACAAGAGDALVTQPPGYVLRVAPDAVDAARFERIVTETAVEVTRRPAWAADRLADALALWRGPAYAEFADLEFFRYEAMRLDELRLVATEERFEACLAAGRHAELISEIEGFAAAHSIRERPQRQLMTALYRCGRQVDALAVYRAFRRQLADQLGLEPSPALGELHEHILRGRPPVNVQSPAREQPRPQRQRIGNLSLELSKLVGRSDDIAVGMDTLARRRMVTVTGVGGVGKTRLALRIAAETHAQYPHGVWVCKLADARAGWQVPVALASVLGLHPRTALGVIGNLVDFLGTRRALLVFDNCEHLLDSAAGLVDLLVSSCPEVSVLATSREPLGLDGEHVVPVRPLPVPSRAEGDLGRLAANPSVALFTDRATAATPAFTLDARTIGAVTEICRRLDGLPLAIELAASRVGTMSVEEILDRLDNRLHFLRSTGRVREERHRSLGATVDWSYRLLTRHERHIFDVLSGLPRPFSMDEAVAAASGGEVDTGDVMDIVASLVHKSMLSADTASTPTRFKMLGTLRVYSRERYRCGVVTSDESTVRAPREPPRQASVSGERPETQSVGR
jgi:predicted ATPase/DNA-binding SARP family transcriptional activator